jgi:hypothetical protein
MRNDYLTNVMGADIEQVAWLEDAVQNGNVVHGVGASTAGSLQPSSAFAQNVARSTPSMYPRGPWVA